MNDETAADLAEAFSSGRIRQTFDRETGTASFSWWDRHVKPAKEIKPGDLLSVRNPHAWMREVESIRHDVDVFDSHPIVEVTFRYDDREGDSRMIALGAEQKVRTD